MTLWLTLLLVWTTGIPTAVFVAATLGAHLHERRLSKLGGLFASRRFALRPAQPCHRRGHSYGVGAAHARRGFATRRR
jgi:hypothetical protein